MKLTRFLMILLFSAATALAETDPRLHSDGQGWRLDQAKITDAKLPRVLMIGDSILNGYLPSVRKALDGKAYVDAWVNPYCQSSNRLHEMLAEVLEHGPYDVVHFNMGLHGWQKGRIPDGKFEELTKAYVEVMQAKAGHAKLIWASTTPVTAKGKPGTLDQDINPVILEHNRMAAKVMEEMHVTVEDLYAPLADHLDLARGDQFHWTGPGYKILTETISGTILRALSAEVPATQPGASQTTTKTAPHRPAETAFRAIDVRDGIYLARLEAHTTISTEGLARRVRTEGDRTEIRQGQLTADQLREISSAFADFDSLSSSYGGVVDGPEIRVTCGGKTVTAGSEAPRSLRDAMGKVDDICKKLPVSEK